MSPKIIEWLASFAKSAVPTPIFPLMDDAVNDVLMLAEDADICPLELILPEAVILPIIFIAPLIARFSAAK